MTLRPSTLPTCILTVDPDLLQPVFIPSSEKLHHLHLQKRDRLGYHSVKLHLIIYFLFTHLSRCVQSILLLKYQTYHLVCFVCANLTTTQMIAFPDADLLAWWKTNEKNILILLNLQNNTAQCQFYPLQETLLPQASHLATENVD